MAQVVETAIWVGLVLVLGSLFGDIFSVVLARAKRRKTGLEDYLALIALIAVTASTAIMSTALCLAMTVTALLLFAETLGAFTPHRDIEISILFRTTATYYLVFSLLQSPSILSPPTPAPLILCIVLGILLYLSLSLIIGVNGHSRIRYFAAITGAFTALAFSLNLFLSRPETIDMFISGSTLALALTGTIVLPTLYIAIIQKTVAHHVAGVMASAVQLLLFVILANSLPGIIPSQTLVIAVIPWPIILAYQAIRRAPKSGKSPIQSASKTALFTAFFPHGIGYTLLLLVLTTASIPSYLLDFTRPLLLPLLLLAALLLVIRVKGTRFLPILFLTSLILSLLLLVMPRLQFEDYKVLGVQKLGETRLVGQNALAAHALFPLYGAITGYKPMISLLIYNTTPEEAGKRLRTIEELRLLFSEKMNLKEQVNVTELVIPQRMPLMLLALKKDKGSETVKVIVNTSRLPNCQIALYPTLYSPLAPTTVRPVTLAIRDPTAYNLSRLYLWFISRQETSGRYALAYSLYVAELISICRTGTLGSTFTLLTTTLSSDNTSLITIELPVVPLLPRLSLLALLLILAATIVLQLVIYLKRRVTI